MDFSKLSHGAKLVLGGTIAFLIVSFFSWQKVEFAGIASAGRSMWAGWGLLAGLLAIALLVWEAIRLANIEIALPVTPAMTSAFLAILLLLATVLKFLSDNEFRTFFAWLGLLLAIGIVAGAVTNMKEAGQSFTDVKDTLAAGAAAATSAARGSGDDAPAATPEAPAAPAASAAPAAPAPPAAPVAPEVVEDAAPASYGVPDTAGDAAEDATDDAASEADDAGDDAPRY